VKLALVKLALAKLGLLGLSFLVGLIARPVAAETVRLEQIRHVHGIEASAGDPGRLYLATHTGLYLASPDGTAEKISVTADDLMGFAADPASADVFLASGHPPSGGNLGVIRSEDGGRTWSQVSKGVDGPVDFHAMDISKADPSVVYGSHGGLQVSRDGGKTWAVQGPLPGRTYDLAASAVDADTVYAATGGGLMRSRDAGKTWKPAHLVTSPASMVHTAADGTAYAFIVGIGLIETKEPALAWKPLSNAFGQHVLLHLAVAPDDPKRLYGVAETSGVVTSNDGGRTWTGYEGSDKASAERIARGAALYREYCQSCHGVEGAGEPPENVAGTDLDPAPALDDSAHAWHHSDNDLVAFILEGFEHRGGRMPGWKETLSGEQAEDIVAYFKSLWSFRSFACQGARHMACMRHGQRN
jgi:mono/diheme cytochrome c family protein